MTPLCINSKITQKSPCIEPRSLCRSTADSTRFWHSITELFIYMILHNWCIIKILTRQRNEGVIVCNDTLIDHIKELCKQRNWSYYRLAKEANMPYSTVNAILTKPYMPSIPTLRKICAGFGLSLSQFFAYENDYKAKEDNQTKCIKLFQSLDQHSQELALVYMNGLIQQLPHTKDKNTNESE